jgi:hypothetical protein
MREFTRIMLRILMCVLLLVGCGQNMYYLGQLARNNAERNASEYYNRNSTYVNEIDESEFYEDTTTISDTAYNVNGTQNNW